jgi:hypothetical protein
MIVFRKTVCSSSTNGTNYTYSSRLTTKMRGWLFQPFTDGLTKPKSETSG